jgi:hypothetical protein
MTINLLQPDLFVYALCATLSILFVTFNKQLKETHESSTLRNSLYALAYLMALVPYVNLAMTVLFILQVFFELFTSSFKVEDSITDNDTTSFNKPPLK